MLNIIKQLNFPKHVFLLRGNHECRQITEHFTFRSEVIDKYNIEIYNLFMESFEAMPIAATVNNNYFCVHGGISPDMLKIDDINQKVYRFLEPPHKGLLCDLLWSDPVKDENAQKVTF